MITPEQIKRLKELYEKSLDYRREGAGRWGKAKRSEEDLKYELYNMLPDLLEAAEPKAIKDIDFLSELNSPWVAPDGEPIEMKEMKQAIKKAHEFINDLDCPEDHCPSAWIQKKEEVIDILSPFIND